jgi:radical SAM-linked protein
MKVNKPTHSPLQSDLRRILLSVEKPGRYTGGEYGVVRKESSGLLRIAISYPDLYEIGMSNLAVRYLYQQLNAMEGVACERVFAPALDFESALRSQQLPLYSLETATPLHDFDLIGFSVGYELTLTNLLNILDLGGIHPLCTDRAEHEPVVIAGGPAVTNPAPFGRFLDAVFIGEFEAVASTLVRELVRLKARGVSRSDMIAHLAQRPYIWVHGKTSPVRRTHWQGFGGESPGTVAAPASNSASATFPVPNIKTVQDHGVVEIMRGCPNGCRFCHAGILYRPYRQKDPERIAAESAEQIFRYGYREITLSSLSSGDYPSLPTLVEGLTRTFEPYKVSFSLPSLRINSLTLGLMSELSSVRKSGLTFAVETPLEQEQRSLNKLAPLERTVALLQGAKERGWRVAKFYFMVGLPVSTDDETEAILDMLAEIRSHVHINLNVNVSCFIPKPHTPFQWAAQLTEQQALDRIMTVKRAVSGKGVAVRYHSPFLSLLEGVLSRGDERAGELFYQGYLRGARFDSWEELIRRDLWRSVFAEAGWDVERETCRLRGADEALPWDPVQLGVSKAYLRREYEKALRGVMTEPCCPDCREMCGVCGGNAGPRVAEIVEMPNWKEFAAPPSTKIREGRAGRILFAFRKQDSAIFLGHLDVMQIFERTLLRAGYQSEFTEGFNPKPRIEFAQPLSLGIASEEEIALAEVQNFDGEEFAEALNRSLPEGFEVTRVRYLPPYQPGRKKHSLMSLYRGSEYRIEKAEQVDGALLSRLAEKLAYYQTDNEGNVHLLYRGSDSLFLRITQVPKRTGNIHKILAAVGIDEGDQSELMITRVKILAHRLGSDEEAFCSYFDLEV